MEIKELTDKIQVAVEELHKAADEKAEEIKKYGASTAETRAIIEKANVRIDELEVKLQRQALPGHAEGSDPAKAAHKAAFFKWMREGKGSLTPEERKALVADATGLYLVPEEIEAEIIRSVPQLNAFRKLTAARTITRDKIRKRTLTEVSVGWGKLETGTDITETTPTPATDYIYAEDLYGLAKIGEDELMDVDANLAAIIADSFSIARANAEEAAFAIGTGHTYQQPCGIAVDTALMTGIGNGAGAAAVGTYGYNWTTDDTPIFEDIMKCEYLLPTQYLPGSAWLMNRKTELVLRGLRAGGYGATDGPWLWQPSLQVGQPNNIDGFPVYNNNSMKYAADTTAGINVIFGNFTLGYRIIDRMGMTIQRLDELYAEAGLIGFKAHFRVGGDIIRRDAFAVLCNDV
jgi:HK97 family phage major capsid protein